MNDQTRLSPSPSWIATCGTLTGFLALVYASQPIANNFDQGQFWLAATALPALVLLLACTILQKIIDGRVILAVLLCFEIAVLVTFGTAAAGFEMLNGDHVIYIAGYMTVYHPLLFQLVFAGLPSMLYVATILKTRSTRDHGAPAGEAVITFLKECAWASVVAISVLLIAARVGHGASHLVMAGVLIGGHALESRVSRHGNESATREEQHHPQASSAAKGWLLIMVIMLAMLLAVYSWSIDYTWTGTLEGNHGFWSETLNERLALPEATWTLVTFSAVSFILILAGKKWLRSIANRPNAELVFAGIAIGILGGTWGVLHLGMVPFGIRPASVFVPWILVMLGCWLTVYATRRSTPAPAITGGIFMTGFLATWVGMLVGPEGMKEMEYVAPAIIGIVVGLVAILLLHVTPVMLEGRTLLGSPVTTVRGRARRPCSWLSSLAPAGAGLATAMMSATARHRRSIVAASLVAAFTLPLAFTALPAVANPTFQLLANVENHAIFYLADPTTRIHPDHVPTFGQHVAPVPNATIALFSARNEHEAVQVVMRPVNQKHFSVYDITFTGFLHENGVNSIDAAHFHAYRVRPVEALSGIVPDVLEPFAPFGAGDGKNHPLWFRYFVPANATPGDYKGNVSLSVDSREWEWGLPGRRTTVDLSVCLHVFNFTLPAIPSLKSHFGYWNQDHFDEVMTIFQRNRMMRWESNTPWPVITAVLPNGSIDTMNFTATDERVEQAHGYGTRAIGFHVPGGWSHQAMLPLAFTVNGVPYNNTNYSLAPEYNTTMQEYFHAFADHYKNKTYIDDFGTNMSWFEDMYINGNDEIDGVGGSYRINALAYYRWLAAIDCPFPLMQTVGGRHDDTWEVLEAMPGGTIICWHTTGREEPHVTAWKDAGRDVWIYTTRGPRFPTPSISTSGMATQVRALGWQCFVYNYTSYLIWDVITPGNARQGHAYQGWSGGSLLHFAPGGGYFESTRLELVREGFEDHEYFTLLAREPPSAGRDALLARIHEFMPVDVYQPPMDYRAFQQFRIEIGGFLSS